MGMFRQEYLALSHIISLGPGKRTGALLRLGILNCRVRLVSSVGRQVRLIERTYMSLLNPDFENVYLLGEVDENSPNGLTEYRKIGSTTRTHALRASELQTGNPRKLKLQGLIKTSVGKGLSTEALYHNFLHSYRSRIVGGKEWYEDKQDNILRMFEQNSGFVSPEDREGERLNEAIQKIDEYRSYDTFQFCTGPNGLIEKLANSNVVVLAPPKCGKRVMVQTVSVMLPYAEHIYIVALNRKDMKSQFEEAEALGITVVCPTKAFKRSSTGGKYDQILTIINKSSSNQIFIHFDECDYGSAIDGSLFTFLDQLRNQLPNDKEVKYIVYSATPEEAIASKASYDLAHFQPDNTYYGPKEYVRDDLVRDAAEFFTYIDGELSLTDQAHEILKGHLESDKRNSIIRLSHKLDKKTAFQIAQQNGRLDREISKYYGPKFELEFINKDNDFKWGFGEGHMSLLKKSGAIKKIYIINQTCTRGTEIGFHPTIYAFHDYRRPSKDESKSVTSYATYAQSVGRVFYRTNTYESPKCLNEFGNTGVSILLYAEKELLDTMVKVYGIDSSQGDAKENMLAIWKDYKSRPVSGRITTGSLDTKETYKAHAILDSEAEQFIKKLLVKIVEISPRNSKGETKKLSVGVLSAGENPKSNICKEALRYENPKGRNPSMFRIESNFSEVLDSALNRPPRTKKERILSEAEKVQMKATLNNSFNEFKAKIFSVVYLTRSDIISFYYHQSVDTIERQALRILIEEMNVVPQLCLDLESMTTQKTGQELLDLTLHSMMLYKEASSYVRSNDSGHNTI
jgi:hypothetical protein